MIRVGKGKIVLLGQSRRSILVFKALAVAEGQDQKQPFNELETARTGCRNPPADSQCGSVGRIGLRAAAKGVAWQLVEQDDKSELLLPVS